MARKHDDAKTAELQDEDHLVDTGQGGETEDLVDATGENAGADADDQSGFHEDTPVAGGEFAPSDPTMLLGEMRDDVLDGIKGPVGWKKLKEAQQVFLANAVEQACRRVIRGAMRIAATADLDAIEVTIKDPGLKSDKDQIEAKIIMGDDAGAWMRLREHGKRTLVFADHEKLMGARAAAVMKDQPGLFPDGTETPAEKAKREEIERENIERAESEARARQFTECEPPAPPPRHDGMTVDNETGEILDEEPKLPRTRGRRALPAPTDA